MRAHVAPAPTPLEATIRGALALLAPPPLLTVSQWADANVIIPRGVSASPGPWRTDRAPYQREMMDVVNDPLIHTVVFKVGSQLGKTATEENTLFYFVGNDPSPILFVLPTEKDAEDFSKEHLAPFIRDTPALTRLFADPKTRASGNTALNKTFPGGYLALAGANAPRGLARRSVRILIMDEIDGYPASSGSEGDPITLGEARTTNFWNAKKIFSSTPTNKGASRIEALEDRSDQRRYMVPCPHCQTLQQLEFERLQWPRPTPDDPNSRHRPEACYYVCAAAGCEILEHEKPRMLRLGRWVKTNPDALPGVAGFQLSSLYSPWFSWPNLIAQYLKAFRDPALTQPNPELLKAFTNTRLAQTYEASGETVDDASLLKRRSVYPARVPLGVLVLTAGVDVQANRIELEIVGWGENDRSWSIDYHILRGNPAGLEVWAELDGILSARYRHASGADMRVTSAFVDSGYHTRQVYKFVGPRQVRRVFASKGLGGPGHPLIRPRAQNRVHRGRVDLRLVGIDAAKEALYGNLQIEDEGPGFCAFPSGYRDEDGDLQRLDEIYNVEYFAQLTGEQLITRMDDLTPIRTWEKKRERNEVLDCRVLAMAALEDLNVPWRKLAANMGTRTRRRAATEAATASAHAPEEAAPTRPNPAKPAPTAPQPRRPRRRVPGYNFIHG